MDYKELYECEMKRADKAEDELAVCKAQLAEEKNTARYSWDRMLETAGRAIKAELENEKMREHISYLTSGIPRAPRECYACGSVDVVSNWFVPKWGGVAGFGTQPTFIRVWYCARHEPKSDDVILE